MFPYTMCSCGGEAFIGSDCRLAGQEQICRPGQDTPGPLGFIDIKSTFLYSLLPN